MSYGTIYSTTEANPEPKLFDCLLVGPVMLRRWNPDVGTALLNLIAQVVAPAAVRARSRALARVRAALAVAGVRNEKTIERPSTSASSLTAPLTSFDLT